MKSSTFTFDGCDGIAVHAYEWAPDGAPRAIVQISHGMQEHAARYARAAAGLTRAGYVVFAGDHRGHGLTLVGPGKYGHLGQEGHRAVVEDLKHLTDIARQKYPGLPVFLLGHSWGSFLNQVYIQRWGNALKGVILSGTNGIGPPMGLVVALCRAVTRFRGADRVAGFLEKMVMGHFNKAFRPGRTGVEWLTRDEAEVDKFLADPTCGIRFPNSFFLDMMTMLRNTWRKKNERQVPRELPILMFAGTKDPAGYFNRGVVALAKRYRKYGVRDVTTRFYDGGRHEMLNETNRDEVVADLITWLDARMKSESAESLPLGLEGKGFPQTA